MARVYSLLFLGLCSFHIFSAELAVADEGKTGSPRTASQRFQALLVKQRSYVLGLSLQIRESDDPKSFDLKMFPEAQKRWKEFSREAIAIAEEFPSDPAALEALMHHLDGPLLYTPQADRAVTLLLERHVNDKAFIARAPAFVDRLRFHVMMVSERMLRALIKLKITQDIQGRATYSLAYFLHRKADFAAAGRIAKEQVSKSGSALETSEMVVEARKWLTKTDVKATRLESERLYKRVIEKHAELKIPNGTLGEAATREIDALQHLAIGEVAPEIVGKDDTGKKFKLSDYRGNVIVLFFSAQWCAPCKAIYPRQRKLIEKFKHRPFVVVGVSGDDLPSAVTKAKTNGDITWRCFVGNGPKNSIAQQWNVDRWPSVFILDHKGRLVVTGVKALDNRFMFERLVEAAEKTK